MDHVDDHSKLSKLLKEWQVSGAPASLDTRVLGPRGKWWRILLTGSIRVPVPVVVAIAAILLFIAVVLVRMRPAPLRPVSRQFGGFSASAGSECTRYTRSR